MTSTALLTDRYELTMLEAARASGLAERAAVFEVFARSLPAGRRFGIVAGLGRLLDAISSFRFADAEIAYLESQRIVSAETLSWLASFRFTGDVDAYAEGECYFPGSPVCTVSGSFGEAMLLETVVLSILNFDTAVASAGARMVLAAGDRPLIEMGSRRVHEEAAVAAARAAFVAGFASTSNLAAGARYAIPTAGTASHAFVLAYPNERAAFDAQIASTGVSTTLLVDTYDVGSGIANAVAAARDRGAPGPGAIRLDSGDPRLEVPRARALLDGLGATATRIIVSSDIDEHVLVALRDVPADAYGVGTSVVTGSGAPTASFVYKLVAIADASGAGAPLRHVAKRSEQKVSVGGRKTAYRLLDASGEAVAELCVLDSLLPSDAFVQVDDPDGTTLRPLQRRVVAGGEILEHPSLAASRSYAAEAIAEVRSAADLSAGPPALVAEVVDEVGNGISAEVGNGAGAEVRNGVGAVSRGRSGRRSR